MKANVHCAEVQPILAGKIDKETKEPRFMPDVQCFTAQCSKAGGLNLGFFVEEVVFFVEVVVAGL